MKNLIKDCRTNELAFIDTRVARRFDSFDKNNYSVLLQGGQYIIVSEDELQSFYTNVEESDL